MNIYITKIIIIHLIKFKNKVNQGVKNKLQKDS